MRAATLAEQRRRPSGWWISSAQAGGKHQKRSRTSLPSSDELALSRLPDALTKNSLDFLLTTVGPTVQVSPLSKLAVTVPGPVIVTWFATNANVPC
jgi:hypothetical protein